MVDNDPAGTMDESTEDVVDLVIKLHSDWIRFIDENLVGHVLLCMNGVEVAACDRDEVVAALLSAASTIQRSSADGYVLLNKKRRGLPPKLRSFRLFV